MKDLMKLFISLIPEVVLLFVTNNCKSLVFYYTCSIVFLIIEFFLMKFLYKSYFISTVWIIGLMAFYFSGYIYNQLDTNLQGCIWYFILIGINVFLVYITCSKGYIYFQKIFIEMESSNKLLSIWFICLGFFLFSTICLSICIVKFVLLLDIFFIKQNVKQDITAVAIVVTLVTYIVSTIFRLSLRSIDNLKQK